MQAPLKKSYFDAMDDKEQKNERQKDDDDNDDDITILNKNDGNHNKKIETETKSNNIPPKISESPLKKPLLSDKLNQKWKDLTKKTEYESKAGPVQIYNKENDPLSINQQSKEQ